MTMPSIDIQPLEINNDMLNLLWANWLKQNDSILDSNSRYKPNYQFAARSSYNSRKFEDWLWSKGFGVSQKNGVRFLKYYGTSKDLTMFLLMHNIN